MFYPKRTRVTSEFRDRIQAEFPNLKEPRHWRLLNYILFTSSSIYGNKPLPLPFQTLAVIEGKKNELKTKDYNGLSFLKSFQEVVPDFKFYSSNSEKGLARSVKSDGMPAWVHEERAKLINTDLDDLDTYFDDGSKYSPAKRKKTYEQMFTEVEAKIDDLGLTPNDKTYKVIKYLHERSQRRYNQMLKENWGEALAVAKAIKKDKAREVALRHLDTIRQYPLPVLMPVEGSDRAFSYIESPMTINREVRKVLMKGYDEYDLKSAQLAVVATLWKMPALKAFLADGRSVWQYLAYMLDLPLEPLYKEGFKKGLYTLVFGGSEAKIKASLTSASYGRLQKRTQDFLEIPMIEELLDAREKRMDSLLFDGATETASGKLLRVYEDNIKSVLAQEAQSLELELIYPVFKLAMQPNAQFEIVLYQFDGLTIFYKDPRSKSKWEACIKEAVKRKAEEWDINTYLEG